jgi:acetyltransferase-like isoleucine patch superfamily enzyme
MKKLLLRLLNNKQKDLIKTVLSLSKVKRKVKGQQNRISFNGALLKNVTFDIEGDNNVVLIKRGAIVSNTLIHIRGNNHTLTIGEYCWFMGESFIMIGNSNEITLGEYTTVQQASLVAGETETKIIIGKDCMFSNGIYISTTDWHSIVDLETDTRINAARDIVLGEHVWLGLDTQITKGVTIGGNCIIGFKSLVTKDVPPNTAVAGIPAKVIRTNISWDRNLLA